MVDWAPPKWDHNHAKRMKEKEKRRQEKRASWDVEKERRNTIRLLDARRHRKSTTPPKDKAKRLKRRKRDAAYDKLGPEGYFAAKRQDR